MPLLGAVAEDLGITAEPDYDRAEGWQWKWINGPTITVVSEALGSEEAARVRAGPPTQPAHTPRLRVRPGR